MIIWKNSDFDGLGARYSCTIDADGTIYIAGAEGPNLCVISEDEFESVISTLANIPGNEFINDPPRGYGSVVVRITYSNGDFELIGRHNSSVHLASGRNYAENFLFNQEGFSEFLLKYVDESEFADWP